MARHQEKVVMIKGAVLPGEKVEAVLEDEKKDYLTASVKRIIEPSSDRIEPACAYFGVCGGCSYQHAPYALQVHMKEEILRDCLRRIAKTEEGLSSPVTGENPWNYRLRGKFQVSGGKIGFYRVHTRDVVEIEECPLMADEINELYRKARPLIDAPGVKEVHITGGDNPILMIHLPAHTKINKRDCGHFAARFLQAGFSGVSIEAGTRIIYRYGASHTILELGGLKYALSPASFFQSNWKLNMQVVENVKRTLQPLKDKKVLDLYAGAGNFSLPLASGARVTAVEGNRVAVKDGRKNLKINNIRSCKFIHSSAEHFRAGDRFDIVILDPPRPGLTGEAMNNMLSLSPEKIVYISCNPATFSRDLKKLSGKYKIESVRMIDFFPQTYHIEVLAFLKLK